MFKIVQKQTYTFLSHRYGILLIFSGIILVIVSAFQFGEVAIEWSQDRYSRLFNIYHDNIANKAFENRMCLPIPIDAVYTWVNGSDPKLLRDLDRVKREVEASTAIPDNTTSSFQCRLKDCIGGAIIITSPFLEKLVTTSQLGAIEGSFLKINKISNVTKEGGKTNSLLQFSKREDVDTAMKAIQSFTLRNKNYTLSKGYITSDWTAPGGVVLSDRVLVTGVEKDTTKEEVQFRIADAYQDKIGEILVENVAGLAIVFITDAEIINDLVADAEKTNTSSTLKISKAYLVWNMEHEESKPDEDYAPNRFEDNEELRYSLRSLEKHAPWIRRVYIVTNGQIPSWLNLDNPRLVVVSHDEIFLNKTHLPTFSSPAIESHIHRIPGISKKFIYLNDDTMFGKNIWPDDFYTHASGQKIYLTWPVPNCAEGCPSSWIKDNYCDKACNNSECEWDGGDCQGVSAQGVAVGGVQAGASNMEQMYCNTGCANGWIADKYCDQACNVPQCGFDAGDCGNTRLHSLYSVLITGQEMHVTLPKGLLVAYFNVTPIFGEGSTITEGKYDNEEVVRTATIAQKFKTVHLLLYKNISESVLTFHIAGKSHDESPLNVTFNVTVNTKENKNLDEELRAMKHPDGEKEENKTKKVEEEEEEPFDFKDVSQERRGPKLPLAKEKEVSVSFEPKEEELTEDIAAQLKDLQQQLQDGDITQRGHDRLRSQILAQYMLSPEYTKRRREVAQGLHRREGEGPDIVQVPHQPDGQAMGDSHRQGQGIGQAQGGINQQVVPQFGQTGQDGKGFRGQLDQRQPAGKPQGQGEAVFKDTDIKHLPQQLNLGQQPVLGVGGQGLGQGQGIGQQMNQGMQVDQGPQFQRPVPGAGLQGFGQQVVQGMQVGNGQLPQGQAMLGNLPLGQAAPQQGGVLQGQLPGQMPLQPQAKNVFRERNNQGFFRDRLGKDQVINPGFQQNPPGVGVEAPQVNAFGGVQQGFHANGGQAALQNAGNQNFGNAGIAGDTGALKKEADAFDDIMFGGNIYNAGKNLNLGQAKKQDTFPPDHEFGKGVNVQHNAGNAGLVMQPGQGIQQPAQGFQAPGVQGVDTLNLGQKEGIQELGREIGKQPVAGQGLQQGPGLENQPLEQGQGQQDDKPLVGGGGVGLNGQDQIGLQQGVGQVKEDPKLENVREKYKDVAKQFKVHKMNKIPQDQGRDQDSLNQPMKRVDDVRQAMGLQDEFNGGKKQVVYDAKPLAGIGENLQPAADSNQRIQDNNDMKQGFGQRINQHAEIRDQPVDYQVLNEGQPAVQVQNVIDNQLQNENTEKQKHVQDQVQNGNAVHMNQGKENEFMDNNNVGNLLKEHKNLPFQLPDGGEVAFEDDQQNPAGGAQGNAGDDDLDGDQWNDKGFRKLLAIPDKSKIFLDNVVNQNVIGEAKNILRNKAAWVGRTKQVAMRIASGFLDHEIQKKVVSDALNPDAADHEMKKWTAGSFEHTVPSKEENAIAEEDALRQKQELDRKSSFLPWERTDGFNNLTKLLERQDAMQQYTVKTGARRRLMDTFGDSLRHVNKLFNKKFGYQARKVPAHMPHMMDVGIMNDLQTEFSMEYDVTSSHRLRHPKDMQHAFSYFYYLMGTPKVVNVTEVFDEFDTDSSGVLSDREIRTLATRLYELPLDLKTLTSLENMVIHCAENVSTKLIPPAEDAIEKYYEDKMPQVTKDLLMHCPPLIDKMQGSVKGQTMYKYEIMGEDEIAFKMIQTNVSQVIGQLDDIRKNPKKFVCLNDNIDHKSSDAYMVKAVLQDFYESLFPIPSQFELPREYRNRFLHIDELREWRKYRDWLRFWTHLSLGALITFSIVSFCSSHLLALKRRCFGRRRWWGSGVAEMVVDK